MRARQLLHLLLSIERRSPRSALCTYPSLFRAMIHRRTLVTDHEAGEIRGRVTALARCGTDRNVVARWQLECRRRHVGKALARTVTLCAIARNVHVVQDRKSVV